MTRAIEGLSGNASSCDSLVSWEGLIWHLLTCLVFNGRVGLNLPKFLCGIMMNLNGVGSRLFLFRGGVVF